MSIKNKTLSLIKIISDSTTFNIEPSVFDGLEAVKNPFQNKKDILIYALSGFEDTF